MTNQSTDAVTPATILSQTAFFGQLTPAQRERVGALGQLQGCAEGQQVYRVGDPATLIYVLVQGMVRQAISSGGRTAPVGDILHRGDVFGWAALTPTCNVRIASTSCLTPCRLLAIDGAGLLALMEQDHTLGYRLMTQLNRLITGTMTAFAGG